MTRVTTAHYTLRTCNWKFVLSVPTLNQFLYPGNHKSDLCFFEVFLVLMIPHISEIIRYFFFLWLISLSIMPSRSIHIAANSRISFLFYGSIVFHCIHIPHFLYSLICQWTLRSLPCLGYREKCFSEQEGGDISSTVILFPSDVHPEWNCWITW